MSESCVQIFLNLVAILTITKFAEKSVTETTLKLNHYRVPLLHYTGGILPWQSPDILKLKVFASTYST